MGERFVSGSELSRRFYLGQVRPLLDERGAGPVHSAALLGPGSEVLGFDTHRSTDHDWGPRVQLFFAAEHCREYELLLAERSGIVVTDVANWCTGQLGFSADGPVTTFDWLAASTQSLAEVTEGEVFHDGLRVLEPVRRRLAWYPDDVWRYVLACQWQRVSQEEAFVGRTREVDDELGSAVVAARLVRDLMRLCLLMARRYPPYAKWLGSAFARLPAAAELAPVLRDVVSASSWRNREQRLADAYEIVAGLHNGLGLTGFVDPATRPYHARPYQVLHAERFAAALFATLDAEPLRSLRPIGAVDQFLDSTDVLQHVTRRRAAARALFSSLLEP